MLNGMNKTNSGHLSSLFMIISATLAAIAGAFTGSRILKKITLRSIQVMVAIMLLIISIGLGADLI